MNDSKNSSNGLLVISSSKELHSEDLAKLIQTVQPLADDLDLTPVALCDGLTVSAIVDYTPLLTRLCAAVEALVAQGEPPSVSEEIVPPALNARPTGLNSRPREIDLMKADAERSFHEREHRNLGEFITNLGKPTDG